MSLCLFARGRGFDVISSSYGDPQLAVKYLLASLRGGVDRLSVRPLCFGAGSGGRTGEDPPSNVELVEKAGDPGCSGDCIMSDPASACAAGGNEGSNEDVVAAEH